MTYNETSECNQVVYNKEIDPSLITRIVQLRYEHCSSKHIALVLGIEEDIVDTVLKKDDQSLKDFIDSQNSTFKSLRSIRKRKTTSDRNKNFLTKRLKEIPSYPNTLSINFFMINDKPFVYEFAIIDKHRLYHLIRKTSDNSCGFIAEKCWQLFHEGFNVKEIDSIFEGPYATGFGDFAKWIDLKIDRRNDNIKRKPINLNDKYEESLHIFKDSSNTDDVEFYMNINIGNGKIKSIRSIHKGK